MGFENLGKQNKKIEDEKKENEVLLNEIKRNLVAYNSQIEKYEGLPHYKKNLENKIDLTIEEFSNFFEKYGFSVTKKENEVIAELKNLNLKIRLNIHRFDRHFSIYGIKDDYPKFNYKGNFVEENPYKKSSKAWLLHNNELHFLFKENANDSTYLKNEIEAINIDFNKLRNRTREDFPIGFLLELEENGTKHISITEILKNIEKEHF
ncbi:hypothetical protein [Rossellomorea marisflavi]|uniref:hypothetical protein n=1 Tax=Rossellomorea marisflavi TaxID=189381 RepID=UPI0009A79900|nr:hypothetical protein [Rossellomorea marisflavi]